MYNRIIVPLDGSRLAEQVLPYARVVAAHLETDVELIHVVVPVERSLVREAGQSKSISDVELDHLSASMRGDARAYLDRVAESLSQIGPGKVSTVVLDGNAAERITEEAAREPGSMIAMSTHGHTGFRHWLMGGITDKVLQTTTVPLFVVRPSKEESSSADVAFKQMLVPLDGSDLGERALPHAASFAKAFGIPVRLMRSIPYSAYEAPPSVYVDMDSGAVEYLQSIGERLSTEGVQSGQYDLHHGGAASGILEIAEREPGTVVVMSTHGRSGISRWALGSVADRVIGHLKVPVLVVRAFDHESP